MCPADERRVLNPEQLDSLSMLAAMSGTDVIGELFQLFETEIEHRLQQIKTSIEKQDAKALSISAHSLRASTGNFGAERLYDLCDQMEQHGEAANFSEVPPLVTAFSEELPRFLEAFSAYRSAAKKEGTA